MDTGDCSFGCGAWVLVVVVMVIMLLRIVMLELMYRDSEERRFGLMESKEVLRFELMDINDKLRRKLVGEGDMDTYSMYVKSCELAKTLLRGSRLAKRNHVMYEVVTQMSRLMMSLNKDRRARSGLSQ